MTSDPKEREDMEHIRKGNTLKDIPARAFDCK